MERHKFGTLADSPILTSQDAGWDMLVMLSCSKVASNVLMLGSMDKELSTPFSHSQTY
jgi:hypothetical protein